MITDALLGLLGGLIGWFVGLVPQWTLVLPQGVAVFIARIWLLDAYLPVTEFAVCAGSAAALHVALHVVKWSVKVVDWIADVIP